MGTADDSWYVGGFPPAAVYLVGAVEYFDKIDMSIEPSCLQVDLVKLNC